MSLEEYLKDHVVTKPGPLGKSATLRERYTWSAREADDCLNEYATTLHEQYGQRGDDIAAALAEAICNIQSHEYMIGGDRFRPVYDDRPITIEHEEGEGLAYFSVRGDENCHGFDPQTLLGRQHMPAMHKRGWGQELIEMHADRVSYSPDGKNIHLVFDLRREP
jgi:hypothetical protein